MKLLFAFIISMVIIHPTYGQEASENQQSTTQAASFSELNIPEGISDYFYFDKFSVSLVKEGFIYETALDTSDYTLGPNDLITIEFQGGVNMLMRGLAVNSNGEIIIPKVGAVSVAGLSIPEAREHISKVANNTYQNVTVEVSIDQPRAFTTHLVGEVPDPGKKIIGPQTRVSELLTRELLIPTESDKGDGSASSQTRSNARGERINQQQEDDPLTLSSHTQQVTGQLAKEESTKRKKIIRNLLDTKYSIRSIVIVHRNGTKDTADLVSYFTAGNLSANPFIEDGDRIKVQKKSKWTDRISISGAVNNQLEIEFLNTDTPAKLLEMAGGYAPDADTTHMYLYRKTLHGTEKITLQPREFKDTNLKPNDRLIVPHNRKKQGAGSAWVYGEAVKPGNYPIKEGKTTALKLLKMAGGTTDEALPRAAQLIRATSPDYSYPPTLFNNSTILNETLLKRTSDQTIQGFEYLDLETRLSQGRVHINLTNPTQLDSVKIYDGDKLYIPRNNHNVFVFGQVVNPGYYNFTKNNRLTPSEYIDKAGGFTIPAAEKRVFVIKAGSKTWMTPDQTQVQSGDMIFVDRVPFQDYNAKRQFKLQKIGIILSGVSTITSIITAYIAITR